MPYSNMTFTVTTGLAFVVNDFVLISAVDTTTTTTTSPIVDCVEFVNIEVTGAGNVTYLDCNGNPQLQNVGIGPEVIGTSLYCVQWSTLSGNATFTIDSLGPSCTLTTTTTTTTINTTTTTSTTTVAPTTTTTSTTTTEAPVYYNILDCGNSSTAFSILYAAGTFATSERCTAVASGFPTRTVIIIGSTTTLPGGPLYTLTSQGIFGCP